MNDLALNETIGIDKRCSTSGEGSHSSVIASWRKSDFSGALGQALHLRRKTHLFPFVPVWGREPTRAQCLQGDTSIPNTSHSDIINTGLYFSTAVNH